MSSWFCNPRNRIPDGNHKQILLKDDTIVDPDDDVENVVCGEPRSRLWGALRRAGMLHRAFFDEDLQLPEPPTGWE